MRLSVLAAVSENGVIGREGGLPWHLPAELRHVKQLTTGHTLLMGRKTYESIGRPLPGRTNIVITRNPDFQAEGVRAVVSLDEALRLAEDIALIDGAQEVVVIGGAEIYKAAIPRAGRLYITEVHASVEGDACLPQVEWKNWREIGREHHPALGTNPYDYSFVVYERLNG